MPKPIELDRESATPLWEQLYKALRSQILNGEIGPDRKIESEQPMAERLGVARGTVGRALGLLQDDGLVVWTKGRGLFSAPADKIASVRRVGQ